MTRRIINLVEIDSTNHYLHDLQDDDTDITLVTTNHQTAGQGQGTNTWESDAGKNLLFSIRIHPTMVPIASQFLLSEMGCLSLLDALSPYLKEKAKDLKMKWPNDIYYGDKKLSGTLIETAIGQHGIKSCIFGVGIDVNQEEFTSDAPNPISMKNILGKDVNRKELMTRILDSFEKYYKMIVNGNYQDIAALYLTNLYRKEGFHKYRDKDSEFEGAIVEVEDNGLLILRDREGRIREYAFKEVEFII